MKGWFSVKPNLINESVINEDFDITFQSKVKITKALVTLSDVLRYTGEVRVENVVLGSYGIGVVSEVGSNFFDMKKGSKVYIEPTRNCGECFNCKSNDEFNCTDIQFAGSDYNGFLRDFISEKTSNLYILPESIPDKEALYVGKVALALSIIDRLNVEKGDHIAIIGGTTLGIILSELLIYYQAVPILIDDDKDNIAKAKKSGVYYALSDETKWLKDVTSITGGRMAKGVVCMSDSGISPKHAFSVASFGAPVVFSGTTHYNSSLSFLTALKKQLVLMFVNSGYGNTAASINLLANKAIDFSGITTEISTYKEVPMLFNKLSEKLNNNEKIPDVIVDLLK